MCRCLCLNVDMSAGAWGGQRFSCVLWNWGVRWVWTAGVSAGNWAASCVRAIVAFNCRAISPAQPPTPEYFKPTNWQQKEKCRNTWLWKGYLFTTQRRNNRLLCSAAPAGCMLGDPIFPTVFLRVTTEELLVVLGVKRFLASRWVCRCRTMNN